jgi:hypothetical protein
MSLAPFFYKELTKAIVILINKGIIDLKVFYDELYMSSRTKEDIARDEKFDKERDFENAIVKC